MSVAWLTRHLRCRAAGALAAALSTALLPACASTPQSAAPPTRVTVFAASSLTETFTAIAADFEAEHPSMKVTLNFGASSSLVSQVSQGAPADVLALADEATMGKAEGLGLLGGTQAIFAQNALAIAVQAGNPRRITSVGDLAAKGLVVVIGAPETPVGAYTQQVLTKAQATLQPASLEPNAKAVAAKVISREADAGIVYESDVLAAGSRVLGVTIPPAENVVARYPIAVLSAASNKPGADAFVATVTSPAGRKHLADAGFAPPS